jgi:hypothetical protein
MRRSCARPGCAASATATLTFDYQAAVVWLEQLASDPRPVGYDLCDRHADGLSVPLGWHLLDEWSVTSHPLFGSEAIAS